MNRFPIAVLALAGISATACEAEREPPPPLEETVFKDQVQALDKARAVEDINDERMKKLKQAVDEQERGTGGN
jgi:uncharacterized protein YceH (UPF0502 family)